MYCTRQALSERANKRRYMPWARGYSLIEIMAVLAIIGTLLAIIIPMINNLRQSAKRTATETQLNVIQTALEEYKQDTGAWPSSLEDLMNKPGDQARAKRWRGPYVDEKTIEQDRFNNEFVYHPAPGQKPPYELYSWGPQGEGSPEDEWIRPGTQ